MGHYTKVNDTIVCTPDFVWMSYHKDDKAIETPEDNKSDYTIPFKCVPTKDGMMEVVTDQRWFGETVSIYTEGRWEIDTTVHVMRMAPAKITRDKKLMNKAAGSYYVY